MIPMSRRRLTTNRDSSHRSGLISNMIARLSLAGLCLLIAWAPANIRAQANAQDRTQSLLDTHKDMDPINPDRSLTTRTRRTDTHIETSPLPPAPQSQTVERQKTLKRIRQLQQEKKAFINQRLKVEKEKAAASGKFMALDDTKMESATDA